MITARGQRINMPAQSDQFEDELTRLRVTEHILGFSIQFHSKTMKNARAYFPSLSVLNCRLRISQMCPMRALVDLSRRRLLKKGFLQKMNKKMTLTKYLQRLTGLKRNIAPYALRIGGRTWLLAKGLDRQFVDFSGNMEVARSICSIFPSYTTPSPTNASKILLRAESHIVNC